jgi:hypothetical protein
MLFFLFGACSYIRLVVSSFINVSDRIDSQDISDHETFQKRSESVQQADFVHPKDLRKLEEPFDESRNQPALVVRKYCVLLNFDPLRAVILHDRLIALLPEVYIYILIATPISCFTASI